VVVVDYTTFSWKNTIMDFVLRLFLYFNYLYSTVHRIMKCFDFKFSLLLPCLKEIRIRLELQDQSQSKKELKCYKNIL